MNYPTIIKKHLPWTIFLILAASVITAEGFELRLGTSQPDDFSRFTGRVLERIFDQQGRGLTLTAVPASDDTHNLTNLQHGALDMALVDSRMFYDAVTKSGHFQFLDIDYGGLRILKPLYKVPITLVVNKKSGIKALDGLRGKRINAGAPLSVQHECMETIMAAKNWSKNDFSLFTEISGRHSGDTMAFCHETVDAMLHIGVHPNSALQQLLTLCHADLAQMKDTDIRSLTASRPAFLQMEIAAGTYPGISKTISTFGTQVLLVTTRELDGGTARQILNIISDQAEALANAHPSLGLVNQAQSGDRKGNSYFYFPQ